MTTADELDLSRPFTIAQARAVGLTDRQVHRLVQNGVLRRVFSGVYVDSAADDDMLARARAVALVLPEGSVVSDITAAWLHGLDLTAPGVTAIPPPLQVSRPLDRTRVRLNGCVGARKTLLPRDVTQIGTIPVTTPLRTALDLGRSLRRERAIVALDAMARAGKFARGDVFAELPRFKGHRGVVQLRGLASVVDARAESPGESLLRLTWLDADLPKPIPQYTVREGLRIAYLDLADPDSRFAAEYDGEEWHSSDDQRAHDAQRRKWLRGIGWRVTVFTRHDFDGWDNDRARRRLAREFALRA